MTIFMMTIAFVAGWAARMAWHRFMYEETIITNYTRNPEAEKVRELQANPPAQTTKEQAGPVIISRASLRNVPAHRSRRTGR